jgi:hypothetical protein
VLLFLFLFLLLLLLAVLTILTVLATLPITNTTSIASPLGTTAAPPLDTVTATALAMRLALRHTHRNPRCDHPKLDLHIVVKHHPWTLLAATISDNVCDEAADLKI